MPRLRDRREDIEPIARLLLGKAGARTGRALRFSPEAVRVLLSHPWPGNVRELENALEFAATVCQGQTIQPEDLPPEVLEGAGFTEGGGQPRPRAGPGTGARRRARRVRPRARRAVPEERAEVLVRALEAHRWNRGETAQAPGREPQHAVAPDARAGRGLKARRAAAGTPAAGRRRHALA